MALVEFAAKAAGRRCAIGREEEVHPSPSAVTCSHQNVSRPFRRNSSRFAPYSDLPRKKSSESMNQREFKDAFGGTDTMSETTVECRTGSWNTLDSNGFRVRTAIRGNSDYNRSPMSSAET